MQEDQRKKISRALHDDISQLLVGINVHLAVFAKAAATNPRGIARNIAPIRRLVEKSLRIVHRFARELRPASLDDLGLIPAIRSYLEDFPKQKGRRIQFTAFAGVEALNNDKRTVLYRVAQEALTNVAKHAHARVVMVTILKIPGGACLEVTDDGKAFDVGRLSSAEWSNHLGLHGMRERVEMVGGRFSVVSVPGQGTTIRAEVPFANRPPPRSE
jgi:signal transduction histidine kinase